MSGTSLDGIDLVYTTFNFSKNWSFEIHFSETIVYPSKWKVTLNELVSYELDALNKIDYDYTVYLAEVINTFIEKYELQNIDAICSHGHTALHQPQNQLTLQIGNMPHISKLTQNRVVCDFRVQDVSLNGQGAPLVPIGDRLLFSEYDYCINLGGFANISSEMDERRIAYDICPVNIVMNRYANSLGYEFDPHGTIARSGVIDKTMLDSLNALGFYEQSFPKSLGLEWVNDNIFPILDDSNCSVRDTLRTFVEHAAIQISQQIRKGSKVLFTGGGTFNQFLMARIQDQKNFDLIIPIDDLINYKEALIFGLLGVLKLREEVNCLASVTGADYDHCSGVIHSL